MSSLPRVIGACLVLWATAAASASALPLVAIDPGHGGGDTGAVGTLPPGTVTGLPARIDADGQTRIYEKDVTLDIGHRLNAYLTAKGFPTLMTRTQDLAGGDVPYTTEGADLKARTDLANAAGAKLFVSIHENALASTTSGTETYHFYYAGPGAKALALLVHQQVLATLGLPDRGVRTAGFYVLRNTKMPAILVEGAFLSNPNEALLLADANVRQRVAEAIGNGVVNYVSAGYDVAYGAETQLVPKFQVNAGSFRKLKDARARYRIVKRRGFDVALRSEYSPRFRKYLFVVVGGKFIYLDNARNLRNRMRAKGIHANVAPVAGKSRRVPV